MASLIDDGGQKWRVQFTLNGARKTLRTRGRSEDAQRFSERVARLALNAEHGEQPAPELSQWLAKMPDKQHAKLSKAGLCSPREKTEVITLKTLFDRFMEHVEVKPVTKVMYRVARKCLEDHFGDIPISQIHPIQADGWRKAMKDDGLAEATMSRRVRLARQVFRKAVKWKMVTENPFDEVKTGSQANKARQFFITREVAQKVLDNCPDDQWKLIFALSRFGGLRCPSEHLALRWADVDFDSGRIRVPSSKTEKYEGHEERYIPIFPELRPHLMAVFLKEGAEGAEFVITRYRDTNANLRTQFKRILRTANITPWPKLFHNLRSTRQTELEDQFPSHVVCAWIGNSEKVAKAHYLQLHDEHYDKAVKGCASPSDDPQKAAQKAAYSPAPNTNPESSSGDDEDAEAKQREHDTTRDAHGYDDQLSRAGLEPATL